MDIEVRVGSMRIGAVIQARMGSARLPGKAMMYFAGNPLLQYAIRRTRKASKLNIVVVATSNDPGNDAIAQLCAAEGVGVFRGEEDDVLDRFLQASRQYELSVIVRLTADNPLVDPSIIDESVEEFLLRKKEKDIHYLRSRGYPIGLNTEVFSIDALELAWKVARTPREKEHVTPVMYEQPMHFHSESYVTSRDLSTLRLTVDTFEDYENMERLMQLLRSPIDATVNDVVEALETHPDLLRKFSLKENTKSGHAHQ